MDNGQLPPTQPTASSPMTANGMPMIQQVQAPVTPKKDIAGLVKIIVIIALALISVTFVGLFIWMSMQYNEVRSDVDGQISIAVAEAKDEQAQKDEAEFLEREKYPYKTFSGPVDYGQLTFEYPKTWSVYIAADAANGGDFKAFFNPVQVEAESKTTIYALRVSILDKSFENVTAEYQRAMERKDANLTVQSVTVNGFTANRYTGIIPNTEFNGFIVVFKIRDKTAILQTDSVLFGDDFNKLVETIDFNA